MHPIGGNDAGNVLLELTPPVARLRHPHGEPGSFGLPDRQIRAQRQRGGQLTAVLAAAHANPLSSRTQRMLSTDAAAAA